MNSVKKYEEVLTKYDLDALKANYIKYFEDLDKQNTSVGIAGEGPAVIQVLADLFDIPELKRILFPRNFCIQLQYGAGKAYRCLEDGTEKEFSFEEFSEKIQDEGGLENDEHVFEGIILLPIEILNNLKIEAYTLLEDIDLDALIHNDICAIALSATHMLSVKERRLIKNPLNMVKCYFLCDLEKVHADEREHVKSLLEPYTSNGEKCYMIPYDGGHYSIYTDWGNTPDIIENRLVTVDAYFKPLIAAAIHEKLSAAAHEGEMVRQIISHLESTRGELPEYKDKTVRYVNTNYIDGIKTNTTSEVLSFYEKLNEDITTGVQEERNVKELQEELPNFVAGEWTEYVEKNLNAIIQTNVDMVAPAIEEYVDGKTDLFLKELLTKEEFDYISEVVVRAIDGGDISSNRTNSVSGNTPLDKKENTRLRSVLPKGLMVLGGIAILSSSILPGALLMAAGLKGNKEALEETQNELIEAGKKLNYDYLKEVQSNLEDLMKRIKASTEVVVEQCYSNVSDSLVHMILAYQDKIKAIEKEIAQINIDLEAL